MMRNRRWKVEKKIDMKDEDEHEDEEEQLLK